MDYGNLQIDLVETNGTVCSPSALGPALWPKDELLRFYDWFKQLDSPESSWTFPAKGEGLWLVVGALGSILQLSLAEN